MKLLVGRAPGSFAEGFQTVRKELRVPENFPPEVLAAAQAAHPQPSERVDHTALGLIAIDPPDATDLDQAYFGERTAGGFRVRYAIADLGSFITAGDPVDVESRRRGTTLYSPDLRTPLHPPVISENRASLLAGTTKPALVWTIDLDHDGDVRTSNLERSLVRVREAISYDEAQRRIDSGDEFFGVLRTIGRLRQDIEAARGGVSLNLPTQEIVEVDGTYRLTYDRTLPVEGWNAQLSLLTGMTAGKTMLDAGVGILRTLPPTSSQNLEQLRRQAKALGVDWPPTLPYPDLVRTLDPDTPARQAFLLQAARSFRGAGYLNIASVPAEARADPTVMSHGAIASVYAHVTAPLRRLVDRFGNEILVALYHDRTPPSWAVDALDELPGLMGKARSRESNLDRALLDFAEAMVLVHMIGQQLTGTVVGIDPAGRTATIQIADPAIVATIELDPPSGVVLADQVTVTVVAADPAARAIELRPV